MPEPLVSICCLTYNHESYICQCLEGFLSQKTNFSFEVLIHDDASSDKTSSIIREYEAKYPDIIKPIYQTENQYSKHVGVTLTFQLPRAKGKYIAMCEGDDYWIDPLKLQKQVDFLESNPEYGLVHTDYDLFFQRSKKAKLKYNKSIGRSIPCGDIYEHIIQGNFIFTATVLLRKKLFNNYVSDIKPLEKKWTIGDAPLWIYISYYSKIHYFTDNTAVYRIAEGSVSHSGDQKKIIHYLEGRIDILFFFANKFGVSKSVMQKINMDFYKKRLILAYYKKDYALAKSSFVSLKQNESVTPKDYLFFYLSNNKEADRVFLVLKKIWNKFKGW